MSNTAAWVGSLAAVATVVLAAIPLLHEESEVTTKPDVSIDDVKQIAPKPEPTKKYSEIVKQGKMDGPVFKKEIPVNEIDDSSSYRDFALDENLPSDNGLIAYYPFNGNANDESNNSFNGQVNNAWLSIDRKGKDSSAYKFDGTGDFIKIRDNEIFRASNSPKSFSLWFNLKSTQSNRPIITKFFNDSSKDWGILALNNEISFNSEKNARNYVCSTHDKVITLNKWHFIVVTVDQPNINIYLDGKLRKVCNNFFNKWVATPSDIEIGRNNYGEKYFHGMIDDIRIYNRVLSSKEVLTFYDE